MWIGILMIMGMIIGSFLNVCIYRIPKKESIIYPSSHCTTCHHPLKAYDLIPIISYVFLGGKCRYCKDPISIRYPIIEIVSGILWGVMGYHFGFSLKVLLAIAMGTILLVLTMIDWDTFTLPTTIIITGTVIGIVLQGMLALEKQDSSTLFLSLAGGLVGYGSFWLIFTLAEKAFHKEALGFGDVRLLGMIGIYVGVQGVFLTIFFSSFIGMIYGIAKCIKQKQSNPFPFGPFLSIAAIIVFLYGQEIVNAYYQLCVC